MIVSILYSVPIKEDYSVYGDLIGDAVRIHGVFTSRKDVEKYRDEIWEPGYDFVIEDVEVDE